MTTAINIDVLRAVIQSRLDNSISLSTSDIHMLSMIVDIIDGAVAAAGVAEEGESQIQAITDLATSKIQEIEDFKADKINEILAVVDKLDWLSDASTTSQSTIRVLADTNNDGYYVPVDYTPRNTWENAITVTATGDISGTVSFNGESDQNFPLTIVGTFLDLSNTETQTMAGNLTITGDLTVNGNNVVLQTTELTVEDNIIMLNKGVIGNNPNDSGFIVDRGDLADVSFLWDETNDVWTVGSLPISSEGGFYGNASSADQLSTARTLSLTGDATGSVSWDLSGDASLEASILKWTTARTLSLTGDATGSVSIDGSQDVSIGVTVTNDSHSHDTQYYTETESDNRFAQIPTDPPGSNYVLSWDPINNLFEWKEMVIQGLTVTEGTDYVEYEFT